MWKRYDTGYLMCGEDFVSGTKLASELKEKNAEIAKLKQDIEVLKAQLDIYKTLRISARSAPGVDLW